MPKPEFKSIEKINLGADSHLELVEVEGRKYVLKTYIAHGGENAITKRNREFYYHKELEKIGLNHFKFHFLDFIQSNQLCFEYLENFHTFDTINDSKEFGKLSKYVQDLWEISKIEKTKFVEEKDCKHASIEDYFNYLKIDVLRCKTDPKYAVLANKFIDELKQVTTYLTLLHSDFHEHNIGLVDREILFFDGGNYSYLYGHKYHDISRILMYYPEGVIFDNQEISPRIKSFVDGFKFDYKSVEFQKFCYLQSLIMYNNPWIEKRKEIADYLYQKLFL